MSKPRFTLLGVTCLIVLLCSASVSWAEFSLNGFLQTQAGIFTSNARNITDDNGYPEDHGGMYGRPSMFRNTLQLEADYSPSPKINLHVVFRGVRSAALSADNWAQVPDFNADTTFNNDPNVQQSKIDWVHDKYYTENDLREIFLDVEAANWLSFRLGRQQVSWGETGSFKLLDVVNPENTSWHLGPFESFEDTRVPLWIAKALIDIPALQGNLELLWIPMIDDPEDTVTVPLTFVGAWGLPVAPEPQYLSDLTIQQKTMIFPKNDLTDSRLGARWKGTLGPITYTMLYFYTHQLSPPILHHVEKDPVADAETGLSNTEVFLYFPRQHVMGGSMDYAIPRPISTVVRLEVAFYPDKPYPLNSFFEPGRFPDGFHEWKPAESNPKGADYGDSDYRIENDFYHEERDTLNYAFVLLRPNQIRWLNPSSSIITQFQLMQTIITDPDGTDIYEEIDGEKKLNENWNMVDIPGYDTTETTTVSTVLVFAALTSYAHGLFNPMIVGVFVPNDNPSGLVSARFKFTLGNHWRLETGVNQIFGTDPYKGLGLFRDRDEVYGMVKFQF